MVSRSKGYTQHIISHTTYYFEIQWLRKPFAIIRLTTILLGMAEMKLTVK